MWWFLTERNHGRVGKERFIDKDFPQEKVEVVTFQTSQVPSKLGEMMHHLLSARVLFKEGHSITRRFEKNSLRLESECETIQTGGLGDVRARTFQRTEGQEWVTWMAWDVVSKLQGFSGMQSGLNKITISEFLSLSFK